MQKYYRAFISQVFGSGPAPGEDPRQRLLGPSHQVAQPWTQGLMGLRVTHVRRNPKLRPPRPQSVRKQIFKYSETGAWLGLTFFAFFFKFYSCQ